VAESRVEVVAAGSPRVEIAVSTKPRVAIETPEELSLSLPLGAAAWNGTANGETGYFDIDLIGDWGTLEVGQSVLIETDTGGPNDGRIQTVAALDGFFMRVDPVPIADGVTRAYTATQQGGATVLSGVATGGLSRVELRTTGKPRVELVATGEPRAEVIS
jgi:hypothetical protein